MTLDEIKAALIGKGLAPRGAFHPSPSDGVPPLASGRPARTLVLAGHAGPAMWRAFSAEAGTGADPLDGWCRGVLSDLAAAFGGACLFPGQGPPYLPFQRWAMRAEPVHLSPIGMLIHPDYGLWHGYRGALALAGRLQLPPRDTRPRPCDTCAEKPCLKTCPVGAFSADGYDVAACVGHIASPAGADCIGEGCRARRACPVGRDHVYEPVQARFHMEAFLKANRQR